MIRDTKGVPVNVWIPLKAAASEDCGGPWEIESTTLASRCRVRLNYVQLHIKGSDVYELARTWRLVWSLAG